MLYVLFCLSLHMDRERATWHKKRRNVIRTCLECYQIRFQYYVYVRFLDYRYFRNILH